MSFKLDNLMELHKKDLSRRGIPFSIASLARYRALFINASEERINREIALKLNPVTPEEKAATHQRKLDRREAAKKQKIRDEENRKKWKKEYEDAIANFKRSDYEAFDHIAIGKKLSGEWSEKVMDIEKDGTLVLKIGDPSFADRHMTAGKKYKFGIHIMDKGNWNTWTLNEDQHDCYTKDTGYGADILIIYDDGEFLFDLDS